MELGLQMDPEARLTLQLLLQVPEQQCHSPPAALQLPLQEAKEAG